MAGRPGQDICRDAGLVRCLIGLKEDRGWTGNRVLTQSAAKVLMDRRPVRGLLP